MKFVKQSVLHCPCGRAKILALGLCSTCYTLKRQDEEHFGGLREAVLERDGYRCRVCDASGRDKRSIIVHYRVPGKSILKLMISLCPACHAPASDKGSAFFHATFVAHTLARTASRRPRTEEPRLQGEEKTGRGSSPS